MSEVQESGGGGKKGKKIRSKKHSTHIDMTPMVDLAFLLLTFFLFTTTLSKPKAMTLILPNQEKNPTPPPKVKDSNAMTIILSKNNRVFYYFGTKDPKVESASFDANKKNAIRKIIIDKRKEVESRVNSKGEPEHATIFIKPDEHVKYKNFVDIMDEMNITGVSEKHTYVVVPITPEEIKMIEGL